MARNPGNADKLMLKAAGQIVRKKGVSGLRIRDVADRAGVNLGMFHYHFKNKECLKRLVLQEVYEVFFEKLMHASKNGDTALEQLKSSLFAMGCFVRDEHEFYIAVFRDILNEDPDVFRFIGKNVPRHGAVISELLSRCQREGAIVRMPFAQVMPILMGAIVFPVLIGRAIENVSKGRSIASNNGAFNLAKGHPLDLLTDKAIMRRIDIALKGLKP